MGEPIRRAYSAEEMIAYAKQFMCDTYGKPNEVEDKDKWYERLGMLVDFISGAFPRNS